MTNAYRHGDVPLHKTDKIEGKKIKHDGSVILAWGEKTGHNHQLAVADPSTMDVYQVSENTWCIELRAQGTLTHPEHKKLIIDEGIWFVGREREYDWFQHTERKVID